MDKIDERFSDLDLNLKAQVKQLQSMFSEIKASVTFQGEVTEELKQKVKVLEKKIEEKDAALKEEIDKTSLYVARENLLYIGIQENENEDIREVLKEFYINSLKLPEEQVADIEYQRVHRIPSKTKPRPIKARFVRYGDRAKIMASAKNLKGTKIFIKEDIPLRMRMARQAQIPALVAARKAGKLAYFSRSEPTKLFVDRVLLPVEKQKGFVENMRGMEVNQAQQ